MEVAAKSPLAAVLLAAGQSSRLGHSKQLCLYEGETLLARSVKALRHPSVELIVVVTGAAREACQQELKTLPHVPPLVEVYNPAFASGMGSSIAQAARYLAAQRPDIQGLLLCVCDQVHMNQETIATLLEAAKDPAGGWRLSASSYRNTLGVPAVFPASSIGELAALEGEVGAKKLLMAAPQVTVVKFAAGSIDIDTPADLQAHQVQPPHR